MMHTSTLRVVKLLRQIIIAYAPGSDQNKQAYSNYYSTITVKPTQLDESGEVKIAIMKELTQQLGLDVKIHSWIGDRTVVIDIILNPKIQPDAQNKPYTDTSVQ